MNAKHSKIKILSLMTLTTFLGALSSKSLASGEWMQKAPMRLGEGQVASIAFSPDGTLLFAAHRTDSSGDFYQAQTVIYWDPQTQEQVGALPPHLVSVMALSPDGTILATSTPPGRPIYLWDVAGQSQMGQIQVPIGVAHLTFSPDGKILASSGSLDDMVRLWDVQTQEQIATISRDEGNGLRRGGTLAFSTDGRVLVVGGARNGTHAVTLWDVETQNQVGELVGHLDATDDLAFNPNGTILASAGGWEDKAVYLWYAQTQEQIGVLGGHSAHVGSIDFSPDGKLLASTSFWDDSIYLWDVKGQLLIGKLNGHDATDFGWGDQVEISSDGKWLACGSENGVELWQANLPGAVPQTSVYGPLPRDGSIHDDTWATLSWLPGMYADSHDVYIGDNFDDVNSSAAGVFQGNQMDTFFFVGFPGYPYPEGLVPGTTYYWRIDEVNKANPDSPWKGPVWSFTVPPEKASNPEPADNAESVELNVVLNWSAGLKAKLHTLYFGDNYEDVANATEGLPQSSTSYAPGPLESAKTYHWRVDEFDGVETHKGDIWSFTTSSDGQSIQPFDANPNRDTATYTVSFSGDLVGSGTRENMPVFDNRIEHMALNEQPLDLHAFFVEKIGQSEADVCFPDPTTGNGIHGINPIQKHPERGAIVTLFFDGFDHNGDALKYRLDLTGYFADLSNWTPAPGTSSDVILTNWQVQSDTKGGRNKACKAEGTLSATVEVYRAP